MGIQGITYVHWQRYPCRVSRPESVRTVCESSGPQGASGNTLKRFCSSSIERAPSQSWEQRVDMTCAGKVAGVGKGGGAHLVMLLKDLLHKLVAMVVELSATARGHVEPARDTTPFWFPGNPVLWVGTPPDVTLLIPSVLSSLPGFLQPFIPQRWEQTRRITSVSVGGLAESLGHKTIPYQSTDTGPQLVLCRQQGG